jgi:hypothetical protein
MADEKDRLGEKLRDLEAAREDQWARQHDAELIEKMRVKEQSSLPCPHCNKLLVVKKTDGLEILACPDNEGAWLDAPVLMAVLRGRK